MLDDDEFQYQKLPPVEEVAQRIWLRHRLLDLGYEPIPVFGKTPRIGGWSTASIDKERIFTWSTERYLLKPGNDHANTGLRTGQLVAVDVDLWNPDHVAAVQEMVELVFGYSALQRRGSKGVMICYRQIEEPLGKIILLEPKEPPERPKTLVEIFGRGGQFVAYGIHPETVKPYRWLVPGYEPLLVPFDHLPPVTHEQIFMLRDGLKELLVVLGYKVDATTEKLHHGPSPDRGRASDAKDYTEMFIELLPVPPAANGWSNFICPACGCRDRRAGFMVLANGGFRFKCFHAGCEFHRATGWEPPRKWLGDREKELYRLLGGDPNELHPWRHLKTYSSLAEMHADMGIGVRR